MTETNGIFTYYCWMRVLPATGKATLFERQSLSILRGMSTVQMLAGPRPPRVSSTSGKLLPDFNEYWYADKEYHGDPTSDTVIDYGPAYADRCEAIGWLETDDGRKWVEESSDYLLFTFELEPSTAFNGSKKEA